MSAENWHISQSFLLSFLLFRTWSKTIKSFKSLESEVESFWAEIEDRVRINLELLHWPEKFKDKQHWIHDSCLWLLYFLFCVKLTCPRFHFALLHYIRKKFILNLLHKWFRVFLFWFPSSFPVLNHLSYKLFHARLVSMEKVLIMVWN